MRGDGVFLARHVDDGGSCRLWRGTLLSNTRMSQENKSKVLTHTNPFMSCEGALVERRACRPLMHSARGRTSSGTMLHSRAHPRTIRDRTTILRLRLISICECVFLEPRPHAERVYANPRSTCTVWAVGPYIV